MPFDEVELSLKLFAKKVLPELREMKTQELAVPSALDLPPRELVCPGGENSRIGQGWDRKCGVVGAFWGI